MTNNIANQLLLSGVDELYNKNKIDPDTKRSLNRYVCENQGKYFMELKFSDFDQINSSGIIFDPVNRLATNSTTCMLQTNIIKNLNGRIVKGFKIVGQNPVSAVYQISYDKISWVTVSGDNAWELIGTNWNNCNCDNHDCGCGHDHYHDVYGPGDHDYNRSFDFSSMNTTNPILGFYLRANYITANVVTEIDILYV
jgi:hypothetical protein